MLIGIDASRSITGQRTGTEAYATHLIRALIPLAAGCGHRLRLYFNAPPPPDLFPNVPHVAPVVIPWPRLWTHVRLGHELRRQPPDVFFTPAHVIPVGIRCPSVATIHDLGYEYFPETHPRRQLAYLRWSTRHNARVARRVIVDSKATRNDLVRFYGTETARIDVVYPGADPGLGRAGEPAIAAAMARLGIVAPYLLYLGTLQPRKNLIRLLAAYVESDLHNEGFSLVLAGRAGWLAGPLLAAVDALPAAVRQRVVLPGYVAEDNKAPLLSGATALVFPSLYEGFGFPVLEAQACGTPVICADSSSLPEVAGQGALLVDATDITGLASAMQRVATEPALRRELAAHGSDNHRRFTWEQAAAQVMGSLEVAGGVGQRP